MKNKRDYTLLLESGNAAMMEKLQLNKHKPGFDKISLLYEYNRICDEVQELRDELSNDIIDHRKSRWEAADIAVRCFLIILECDRRI